MSSCPVCYESFSSSNPVAVPRALPCEDVICTQCLGDCFELECDDITPAGPGVRCPECFRCFSFNCVEAVPVSAAALGKAENGASGAEAGPKEGTTQQPDESGSPHPSTENADPKPNGPVSKLAAFLSSNRTSSHIPAFEVNGVGADGEGANEGGGQRTCKVDGCSNRAVQSVGVCPVHTKRASVVSVSAMVHKFQDTQLSSVALKSDKVEVSRGGVAGAGEAGFDPDAIGQRFRRQERLELGEAVALIEAVKNILREEQNMVELQAPVMVVGDVHGQYFDLLNILKKWRPDHSLLFLGDYVDRGQFSCEVILHLFALKLRHPNKVFLIRGNHECSAVSSHFGFKDECKAKYGLTVYYRFLLSFQTMPICALIHTTIGRIFACHGGISPEVQSLSDIEEIDRFAEPEMQGPLCDMLWADPMNEDDRHKLTDDEYRQFLDTDYVANQVRGCSYMFGYNAVQKFLRENRLMYLVRAHEVQEEGFRSHFPSPAWALAAAAAAAEQDDFTDEDSDLGSSEEEDSYDHILADTSRHLNPTVLTVFSAPNYCDRYRNKAAILHIEKQGYYTVNLLAAEPHPDPVSETDVNVMQLLAMGNTCPYMPTSFREFVKAAVDLGMAVEPAGNQSAPPTPTNGEGRSSAAVLGGSASGMAGIRELDDGHDHDHDESDSDDSGDQAEEEDQFGFENGEDPGKLGALPSFAPRERRGMVSKMTSEPVLGRRSSSSSIGSADGTQSSGDRVASGDVRNATPSWDGDDLRSGVGEAESGVGGGGRGGGNGGGAATSGGGGGRRLSFMEDLYNTMSRSSIRGFGGGTRASSPSIGLLSRQNTWSVGSPAGPTSEHYRKAHARDGINEMHPDVLNRRISHQECGEMENAAAQALAAETTQIDRRGEQISPASTAPVSPAVTPQKRGRRGITQTAGDALSKSGTYLGFGNFASAPARAQGRATKLAEEGGDDLEPSPAPSSRGVRQQFSLDMNVGTPTSSTKRVDCRSRDELAEILRYSSINELAQMEGNVEVELLEEDADNSVADEDESITDAPGERSPNLEVLATPPPPEKRAGCGSGAPSPSQILFTHEEIVVLKLLFSLFDRKGKNFITRDDIVMYAEEGGDFAQLKEVDACMQAVDADGDGKVGLSDYINFAARLKEIHSLQQLQDVSDTLEPSPTAADDRLQVATD